MSGLANVLSVGLIVYLTYFFTVFFSTQRPAPVPMSEAERIAAKKNEEQKAEERELLTTYGPANPATGAVRIPIERAMELVAAEAARPATLPASAPSSLPTTVATPLPAAVNPPAPPFAVALTSTSAAASSPASPAGSGLVAVAEEFSSRWP